MYFCMPYCFLYIVDMVGFIRSCYLPCSHLLNMLAKLSSGTRGLSLGLGLHPHPYFICKSSKGSGETALLCRLV